MNIKMTEDDEIWERVFRNEFYKQNIEESDMSHQDMSDVCSYQEKEHNSLKCTLPDSGFSMENSSNYFFQRLDISSGNKESFMFGGENVFVTKDLNSRNCIECDNPDFRMVDSDEQVMCNFFETGNQKFDCDVEIDNANDVHYQEIVYSNDLQQKTILNENNLEEDAHIDYSNYDFDLKKDNTERATKLKNRNANSKSSLSRKRCGIKSQKTCINGNKSRLHVDDYPIQKMEGGISSRLRSRDGMVGILGYSVKNSKIPQISNYKKPRDTTKRKSKNTNHKSNLSRKRGRTKSQKTNTRNNKPQLQTDNCQRQDGEGGISLKLGSMNNMVGILGYYAGNFVTPWFLNYLNPYDVVGQESKNADLKSNFDKNSDLAKLQKTYIGYDESQLQIDDHMTFELKGDSSCVLGSTNVVVKISGPSVRDTTVFWT